MAVMCEEENRCLTAAVSGELDHHRAKEVMEELDRQIDAALPRKLTLDLSGLTFTDSSGIAVILRTYRRMSQAAGRDDCGPRPGPGPAGVPGGRAGKAGPI
ncbi:MAG: STAS domain-containing protein [Lawsonibacter sp.]